MCGRIATTLPNDAMAQIFAANPANNLPPSPNFNVCPTDILGVVHTNENGRQLSAMRWGFLSDRDVLENGSAPLINARAETIATKPTFREACRQRRCLIPVSGFYEWTKDADGNRLPWYSVRKDSAPIALAGIWQRWDKGDHPISTCAIVTTTANETMSRIHRRMPVIIEPVDWALWLGEDGHGAAPLLRPASNDTLQSHRVARTVNSNRSSGPDLIEPIE